MSASYIFGKQIPDEFGFTDYEVKKNKRLNLEA